MSARNLIDYRRDLHRIPELGFDLPKTIAYVRDHLESLPATVFEPAPSSLCAFFDNGCSDTIAFRADMDGLPVTEDPSNELRSEHVGQMHACGHDGHMSMLLSLCDYVAQQGPNLPHNVLAIFQPAEETTGGARAICESGVLQRYNTKAVFGLHMWPGFDAGTIISRPGELMARTSEVKIDVLGKSVHIAKAAEGRDALYAAARFVSDLYAAPMPDAAHLLKFGLLQAGTVCNVIAGSAHLEGSMRAYNDAVYQALHNTVTEVASAVEADTGCSFEIDVASGYPPVINDKALFARVVDQVDTQIAELEEPSMTGEDFSFYQREVPGVFFFVGTGHEAALHSEGFDFDESALNAGAALLKQLLFLDLS